jgi:hypothetical protein
LRTPGEFPKPLFTALAHAFPSLHFRCTSVDEQEFLAGDGYFNPPDGKKPWACCEWTKELARRVRAGMRVRTQEEHDVAIKNYDAAIAHLVDAVAHDPEDGNSKYGAHVYRSALALIDARETLDATIYCDDINEYNAEVERRRQIGLTIDPATAETTFWWSDMGDPYCLLNPDRFHEGKVDASDLRVIPAPVKMTGFILAICRRKQRTLYGSGTAESFRFPMA